MSFENKKTTIRDIAKLAKVSPSAVSIVLNGKNGVSDTTRKRIIDIAEKKNYELRLTDKKSEYNIALLYRSNLQPLNQMFYVELNASIISACVELPYNLIMVYAYHKDGAIVMSDIVRSGNIDGIIVYSDIEKDILTQLNKLSVPMVVLDSSRRDDNQLAIYVDYVIAAYTATLHLIDLGHRDIAYIGSDADHLSDFSMLTFQGFQKATFEHNITLRTNRIQFSVFGEESLCKSLDNALTGDTMPTALFCANDYCAICTIRYLHSKGLHVPKDISVIGIDDLEISRQIIPSLTTVVIDREMMGKYGIELLQKIINKEPCESITLKSCSLVVRESTAPPRVLPE